MAQQQPKQDYMPLIVLGVGLFAVNKIFGKGPDDTKGGKATDEVESAPLDKNPFMVGHFKVPVKKGLFRITLTSKQATWAASLINDGLGVISDDEAQIVGGIKTAKTKADITFISMMYTAVYKRDLYTDLKKNLDRNAELGSMINGYILKLPLYSKTGTKE